MEVPKEKSVDHNRKRIENLSKANAVEETVIHLDQLEFIPIFPYSELSIWMLHQLTDYFYFDSVYLKIFTALSFWQTRDFCLLPMYCRLEGVFFMLKKSSDLQHGSTEKWLLHGFGRHVVRPWTVPILGMADRESELWMGLTWVSQP